MKFTLEIETSGEAMANGDDVADELLTVIRQLRVEQMGGLIKDRNGNTCGHWTVTS